MQFIQVSDDIGFIFNTLSNNNVAIRIANKILCRVLLNRMKRAVDTKLRDEQAGFRRGRSCTDHIATLGITAEQLVEWKLSAYICFIFQNACDRIHRETLCKLLKNYG